MTRCGIGPKFSIITILLGVLAGWLTGIYPDLFIITAIPYWCLVIIGFIFVVPGIVLYLFSLKVYNRGKKNNKLVVDGPYSVVRHPIYAAWILLICPGIILFFKSWLMFLIPLAAYISFKVCIHEEDDYLKNKFGQAYLDYLAKTNELFPKWGLWKNMNKEQS